MSDHAAAMLGLPRWHPNPYVRASIEAIRRHGRQITAVEVTCDCPNPPSCDHPDCSFSYTSGLTLHDLPELSVYGLDAVTGTTMLDEVGALLHRQDWRTLVTAQVEIRLRGIDAPVRLIEQVDKDELLMANLLFPDAPALQVVWTDEDGHYPWEDAYTLLPMHQPLRGVADLDAHVVPTPRVISGISPKRRISSH
ncbi:DUF4262 domain-containing protein [Gordonia sp. ABSL1-1]|uniref:DUF4262 domain-containing protein n=1 Tax=Gordonia sp. ABSL1-1 TaxID=3053923 RepID=UPI002572D1FF|nr:DUF4262 domain-containing protein [Gordonia sp. ABSL1-1]MDL9936672.1 DUF4262 domain-containing protein [Gordonia sp. ABSL1-1]